MSEPRRPEEPVFRGSEPTASPEVHRGQQWNIPEAEDVKAAAKCEQNNVPSSQIPSEVVSHQGQQLQDSEEAQTYQISRPEIGPVESEALMAENIAATKQRRVKPTVEATC